MILTQTSPKNSAMIAKEVMRHIEGVGIFPLISLILFFVLFSGILIYAFTFKKEKADLFSALPLEKDTNNEANNSL